MSTSIWLFSSDFSAAFLNVYQLNDIIETAILNILSPKPYPISVRCDVREAREALRPSTNFNYDSTVTIVAATYKFQSLEQQNRSILKLKNRRNFNSKFFYKILPQQPKAKKNDTPQQSSYLGPYVSVSVTGSSSSWQLVTDTADSRQISSVVKLRTSRAFTIVHCFTKLITFDCRYLPTVETLRCLSFRSIYRRWTLYDSSDQHLYLLKDMTHRIHAF